MHAMRPNNTFGQCLTGFLFIQSYSWFIWTLVTIREFPTGCMPFPSPKQWQSIEGTRGSDANQKFPATKTVKNNKCGDPPPSDHSIMLPAAVACGRCRLISVTHAWTARNQLNIAETIDQQDRQTDRHCAVT